MPFYPLCVRFRNFGIGVQAESIVKLICDRGWILKRSVLIALFLENYVYIAQAYRRFAK